MTESEWHRSTDPQALCAFVREATTSLRTRWLGWMQGRRFSISERKFRLIYLVCLTRVIEMLPSSSLREFLNLLQEQGEGNLPSWGLPGSLADLAFEPVSTSHEDNRTLTASEGYALSALGVFQGWSNERDFFDNIARASASHEVDLLASTEVYESLIGERRAQLADIVRELIGNPFQPVYLEPAWLTQNDGAVRRIAASIHELGHYHELPFLADALEDARCPDQSLLDHCRRPGGHFKGCWAVDLLLEKNR